MGRTEAEASGYSSSKKKKKYTSSKDKQAELYPFGWDYNYPYDVVKGSGGNKYYVPNTDPGGRTAAEYTEKPELHWSDADAVPTFNAPPLASSGQRSKETYGPDWNNLVEGSVKLPGTTRVNEPSPVPAGATGGATWLPQITEMGRTTELTQNQLGEREDQLAVIEEEKIKKQKRKEEEERVWGERQRTSLLRDYGDADIGKTLLTGNIIPETQIDRLTNAPRKKPTI